MASPKTSCAMGWSDARVMAFCKRALSAAHGEGPVPALEADEVMAAAEAIAELASKVQADSSLPGVWAAVGNDQMAALLSLYALAMRCSSALDASDEHRAAYSALRKALTAHLSFLRSDLTCGHVCRDDVLALLEAVLRTHSLRCYAAALSTAARPLIVQPEPSQHRWQTAALDVLTEVVGLLSLLDDMGERLVSEKLLVL